MKSLRLTYRCWWWIGLCWVCLMTRAADTDPLVTLERRQVPLPEILMEITRQTGIAFSYESSLLQPLPPMDIRVVRKPLSHCLQSLFRSLPVTYLRTGRFVILKKKQLPVRMRGFVTDRATSLPLAGASVYDAESGQGTTTRADGFFSLSVNAGQPVLLHVSYVGYEPFRQAFPALEKDTLLTVRLSTHQQLAEVVITGEATVAPLLQIPEMGHVQLDAEAIRQPPVLFGEADVMKSLQTLPGVSAGMAGLSGLYVRGGSGDDNLYLIEGNPLYQLNHVAGLFTAFNVEAVKEVAFYKSAFPARYGGRLSSVVDIQTREGDRQAYHGSGTLGLTSGSLHLEGPLWKERTSFHLALRRSWIDALSAPVIALWNASRDKGQNKLVARYAFMDLNVKVSHRFNDRSNGHVGLYWGDDFLKGGEKTAGHNGYERKDIGRLRWGNLMVFAGGDYRFASWLSARFNAAFTRSAATLKEEAFQGTSTRYTLQERATRNRIHDVSLRVQLDARPHVAHRLHLGAQAILHHFQPLAETNRFTNGAATLFRETPSATLSASEWAFYLEENWRTSRRLHLHAGIHLSLYAVDGKAYTAWEPRFAARWLATPRLSFKASYARMNQYVHQLNESYLNLPTDTWVPVSRRLRPMRSDQLALGVYRTLCNKRYTISVEGYYKWMNHLIDYKDNYQFLPSSATWEDKLTQGTGRSYGMEWTLRKEEGKVTGRASYTLSWNDRQFPEINRGKRFPAKFDNRHHVYLLLHWKVHSRMSLTGSWTYLTGNRLTVSFENYQAVSSPFPDRYLPSSGVGLFPSYLIPNGIDYYTERNNFRLPAYHRLDVGINLYRPKKEGRMGIWTISLYNAYSYLAPVSLRKGEGYGRNYFNTLGIVPVIPSVSYTYKF